MKISYKDLKPLGMKKSTILAMSLNYNAIPFTDDRIIITTSLNTGGKFLIWLTLPLVIIIEIGKAIHNVAIENDQFVNKQYLQKNETNKEAFDNLMNKLLQK